MPEQRLQAQVPGSSCKVQDCLGSAFALSAEGKGEGVECTVYVAVMLHRQKQRDRLYVKKIASEAPCSCTLQIAEANGVKHVM